MSMRFESRHRPLLPLRPYVQRLLASTTLGFVLVLISLGVGMVGYHTLEGLSWIDSYTNAAMLLSGMGPLAQPVTVAGKLFAGVYALYSGFAVLVIAGVVFAPVVHRALHAFHIDEDER